MRYDLTNSELLAELLKSIPEDDSCMEWPRGRNQYGYGQLQTWNRKLEYLVHRAAYIIAIGPIPEGKGILHRCDNPPCFRPDHLFPGDQIDNMHDCAKKGRAKITSKLTPDDVLLIRALYAQGTKQAELGAQFGLDQSTISNIVTRKRWKLL